MKRCPITYEKISDENNYSVRGLNLLSPQLKNIQPLNFSADEQRQEAILRVGKMSVQGIQMKLSAKLKIKESFFEIVDQKGHFILKPQSKDYKELPENEALTMSLAHMIGIQVPIHGLLYSKDNTMTYFIKRFDRVGHNKKLPVEDFSQLSGENRDTKYNSSMEKVIKVIEKFCTFPRIEFVKLFKLTLFNFLIGNEDMHLKNFSLLTKNNKVYLSPAYDLLNTTIALDNASEEIALPLNGKKNNLTSRDFLEYFAERLNINPTLTQKIAQEFHSILPAWIELINISFLSTTMKKKYLDLLIKRIDRLQI